MIVVADTSVILNLSKIEQARLLQQLFKRVLIPQTVAAEFIRLSETKGRFAGLIIPGWIEILPSPESFPHEVVKAGLDAGESAAIALCLKEKADVLLIDESLGRGVAALLGIRTIGLLGILVESRRRGFVLNLKTLLDRLESDAGFWIAPTLRNRVLDLAGEEP